ATVFLAAVLAGAFLATVFLAAVLAGAFLATVFLAAVLAGAFFATVFLAAVLAGAFFATAFLAAVFVVAAFFAAVFFAAVAFAAVDEVRDFVVDVLRVVLRVVGTFTEVPKPLIDFSFRAIVLSPKVESYSNYDYRTTYNGCSFPS
ncbi:MAG: hypothetical protein ACRBBN_19085, partial [Methyloligellaceae bacterium]